MVFKKSYKLFRTSDERKRSPSSKLYSAAKVMSTIMTSMNMTCVAFAINFTRIFFCYIVFQYSDSLLIQFVSLILNYCVLVLIVFLSCLNSFFYLVFFFLPFLLSFPSVQEIAEYAQRAPEW